VAGLKATPAIPGFNSGEWSPTLEGRSELKGYATACYAMEGYVPMVQGPARRCPGTIFGAEVKNSANRTALTEFIFNVNQSFFLEWGDQYLRFHQNHAPVLSGGVPYEIATPYHASDLFDAKGFFQLVFTQSADVIYITHRSLGFPIYKLSHFATTNWTLAPMVPIGGPFADANPGTNPVVFATAQTGTVTLYASADIFDALLMPSGIKPGAYFQLTQQNIRDIRPWEAGKEVQKSPAQRRRFNGVTYEAVDGQGAAPWTTGSVPPTNLIGQAWDGMAANGVLWEYRDPGYGFVQLKTRGAAPTGAAFVITGITAATPPVVSYTGAATFANGDLGFISGVVGIPEINDKFYRVANLIALGGSGTFELKQDVTGGAPANVDGTGWDAYVSGGTFDTRLWTATADVIVQSQAGTVNRLPASVVGSQNATPIWAVGTWNARDGYPGAVAFLRGRLAFARKGKLDLSVSQDFENFSALTPNALVTGDMAISDMLPTQDAIEWLVEGRILVAGTASAEHAIQEINPSQPLGPANTKTTPQLRRGSRAVRPVVIGKTLVWVQTSGLKVRYMKYDFVSDNYGDDDLANNAEHITQSGIVGLAFQQEPDPVLWAWRADGHLIGLTFSEEQAVVAWQRRPMSPDAFVESGACAPASDGSRDELALIVRRTINGATKRYIEYLAPHFLSGNNLATDAIYADCAKQYAGAPTQAITGLGHLEGRTVGVLADGAAHPDCVITAGAIALNRSASNVTVGLRWQSKLTTMPLEAGSATGTAQGKTKRITSVNVRFLNTLGGKLGRDDIDEPIFDEVEFRQPSNPMDQSVPIFNGIFPDSTYSFDWPAGYEQEGRLTYINDSMFPATVVAIYPDVTVS
jgi:hypothetical protein